MHFKKGMNSKGLSDVITTVLIILLVLVAITIVWQFVSPFLRNTSSKVGADCLTTSLTAKTCTYNPTTGAYSVQVYRPTGAADITAVNLVFTGTTASNVTKITGTIGELETQSYTSTPPGAPGVLGVPTQFDVAPVVTHSDGSQESCPVSGSPVTCA